MNTIKGMDNSSRKMSKTLENFRRLNNISNEKAQNYL